MRVAVLGMGHMGHALAERLLAGGHEVTVWNRSPGKTDELVAKGAREAPTPAQAAQQVQACFTSLADDHAVRAVVTGEDGVAAGIGEGVLVDASTVSPKTTAELAEALGGALLASPVLGAPRAVLAGEATYLIGGPHELYERLRPAYETIASEQRRRYMGEASDGRLDAEGGVQLPVDVGNRDARRSGRHGSGGGARATSRSVSFSASCRSSHRRCTTGSTTSSPASTRAGSRRRWAPRTYAS